MKSTVYFEQYSGYGYVLLTSILAVHNQEVFRLFSKSNNLAPITELDVMFSALGFQLESEEIEQSLQKIGLSSDDRLQSIGLAEFTWMVAPYIQDRNPVDESNKLFDLFDEDKNGVISLRTLRRVAKEVGLNIPDQNMQEMVDEADLDGDGVLSREEFFRVISRNEKYFAIEDLSFEEE